MGRPGGDRGRGLGAMTMLPVRRLSDVRLVDAAEVGGKAASLGELIAEGMRVPDGVVLSVAGAALDKASRDAALQEAIVALGPGPFAARSSAIGEDGADRSYAGMFETVLGVRATDLPAAVDEVLESARSARAGIYDGAAPDRMAVLIQRMIEPAAAGVALTADPITGDRATTIVTAVRGLGNRLVSGETPGDEWTVRAGTATPRWQPERAVDKGQALAITGAAARIASSRGAPQDVEWAIDGAGDLWILQARPMTALPRAVTWDPPAPGSFSRSFRFGEWLFEPVTPLFESWLLTTMEERFSAGLEAEIGQRLPRPYHVLVHGWYFYSLNWATPAAFLRNAPRMLARALRSPRSLAGVMPATVRHAVPILERRWREDLQPRYRAAAAGAEERVDTLPADDLPALIDELATLAGEYFLSIAALTGAAYKTELNLAGFHRRYLTDAVGWSHLPLVSGFEAPAQGAAPAVASLDWWFEPTVLGQDAAAPSATHAAVVAARETAEAAAESALIASPGRLRTFRRLLAEAQHMLLIRDEQTRELTVTWPVMRRGVLRIGKELVESGSIGKVEDVFFLTRDEALAALRGGAPGSPLAIAARLALREEQARLVPPLVVGRLPAMVERMWNGFAAQVGAVRSERALVSGSPASAGRATG